MTSVMPTSSVRGGNTGMIVGGIVAAVFGLLWILAFYASQGAVPLSFLGSWNILIGLILVIAGAVLPFGGLRAPGRTPATPATGATNNLAIAAFVLAFVAALPAVICGHIALGQIQRTGQNGRGLAIASLGIGYFAIVTFVVVGSIYASML